MTYGQSSIHSVIGVLDQGLSLVRLHAHVSGAGNIYGDSMIFILNEMQVHLVS